MKKQAGCLRRLLFSLLAILILCAAAAVLISNHFLTVSRYSVTSDRLPPEFDGYRIVQLSDLHSAVFGRDNHTLVKKIRRLKPDLVVMTGDMVNSTDENFDTFFSLAQTVAKEFDAYFIVGNHEQMLGEKETELFTQSLEARGVTVLDNQSVLLERNGSYIRLYGMWFHLRFYADRSPDADAAVQYTLTEENMIDILGENDRETYSLLLTHNPVYFDTYRAWGADLTLCGHMHGGMVRLPFAGGVYSPEKTFFPQYDAGLFTWENQTMIVSRGLGNGNLGFRFLNCPELVCITLQAGE